MYIKLNNMYIKLEFSLIFTSQSVFTLIILILFILFFTNFPLQQEKTRHPIAPLQCTYLAASELLTQNPQESILKAILHCLYAMLSVDYEFSKLFQSAFILTPTLFSEVNSCIGNVVRFFFQSLHSALSIFDLLNDLVLICMW